MNWLEQPTLFECDGSRLIGIIARPKQKPHPTGVVIIVGGPQYRAGSHRQFTLLARHLAEQGIASIRFDYRGMGDSEGDFRNFEAIEADIRAAIDALLTQVTEIEHVALWGLCDAASAALYYGHTDPRVTRLILLNPWVHHTAGAARARLKHYYLSRLLQKSFWLKLFSGKLALGKSLADAAGSVQAAASQPDASNAAPLDPRHGSAGYIERMLKGLKKFEGRAGIILSGKDLTAQEFTDLLKNNRHWKTACHPHQQRIAVLEDANHTFSSHAWRAQVEKITRDWAAG